MDDAGGQAPALAPLPQVLAHPEEPRGQGNRRWANFGFDSHELL